LFFVVGPLRTGTSLLARCLDDHPEAICLCESEINRALFRDYFVYHHGQRMCAHGFTPDEVTIFLDRKRQDDIESWEKWYGEVAPRLSELYAKPHVRALGDKSPDFYQNPGLIQHLATHYPLIYTVRDPRAILKSIESQADATPEEKRERWTSLAQNYAAWKPYLEAPNLLVVRYEDLVRTPESIMRAVYSHLGLPYSARFLETFERPFPYRFLWTTAIDWETGIGKDFDPNRISSWRRSLTAQQLSRVYWDATVLEFLERFGYTY
jgi:hypothetical protein